MLEFEASDLMNYIIWFTNNLDPNGENDLVFWPQWDKESPKALIFQDSSFFPLMVGDDTYRIAPLQLVRNMSLLYPI